MTLQITQAGGVGAAAPNKGLSGAWLGVAITIAQSEGTIWEHSIQDATDGLTATLAGSTTATATLSTSGGKGSIRGRSRHRSSSQGAWTSVYWVVRIQRDADGSNFEIVPPALYEVPSETAEARGYASIVDDMIADFAPLKQGGEIVRHTAGTPTLTPNAINIVDPGVTSLVCPQSTTFEGSIVVKLKNKPGGVVITRSGADTLNGETTYEISAAWGECVIQRDTSGTASLLVSPGLT